ncbi:MAG: hypothetical protein LBK58_15855 [Prevotellaceae bacterium]|jgi:hypothetical protein|nr:hypothetical protein [Prevotellaceae bacterium]
MTEKLVSVSGSKPHKQGEPEKLHALKASEMLRQHGLFAEMTVNDLINLIMIRTLNCFLLIALCLMTLHAGAQKTAPPFVPLLQDLHRPFGKADRKAFEKPSPLYHPETLMFFIGGNVSKEGISADLEAIAAAEISGIQLFHGQMGGAWPGVDNQITCLSPQWDDIIRHTAGECRRLGLKFAMHNSPGWAMSGGPWIKPENAMRHLVMSRTDTTVSGKAKTVVKLPRPQPSDEPWRDYRDITVIAFPTPADDTGEPLKPLSVRSNTDLPWKDFLSGNTRKAIKLPPVSGDSTHWIEVTFADAVTLRTVEFSSINGFNHAWCYEPGVTVTVQAVLPGGEMREILNVPMPQGSWQDDRPISLACDEIPGNSTSPSARPVAYRISISNLHDMSLHSLRLYTAARKNNWESEAGWTLRSIVRAGENPRQSEAAFVNPGQIREIAAAMDGEGNLEWDAPAGKWTVLRIGHVNTGMKNAPAPPEGTGWECDKLNASGAEAHFAGYIGRLADGPLADGLLTGMHLDSWECKTQTWTEGMENAFFQSAAYPLSRWLPALFGYVLGDHEISSRFLRDWRGAVNGLFVNKYYGRMAELGHAKGLGVTFETAAGDIFPAAIMEYSNHCDVPQTEFWQPIGESYVGSINFKPVKPAASAARLYGKPRLGAEAFTSFSLTWDEHFEMLKEVANINCIEGVTHLLFHTYTHNPQTDWLQPGTSFGAGIGTPFLRGQTWWKYMPEFTAYLSRLNYLLERGKPVSDVLWYLGDEINHKPDQNAPFPKGYKYDYCNPDVLLNRLSVSKGKILTPEGIFYSVLWLPDNKRMLPETLEKLLTLVDAGAVIVGDAPQSPATLSGGKASQQRFDAAVKKLWGKGAVGIRTVGRGKVLSGMSIDAAVKALKIAPDVTGEALWLHRRTDGADWYYVCAPYGDGFKGELSFNSEENVEIWDPVSGEISPANLSGRSAGRTSIKFDLARAGSCFVVFGKSARPAVINKEKSVNITETFSKQSWTLAFPAGWGAPASLETNELKAWKDFDMSPEGRAFSGTVTYSTTFNFEDIQHKGTEVNSNANYSLDLGRVEMIATVRLNGKKLRTLWTPPYRLELGDALKTGENTLQIEVTGTWFNRLVYDAGQPEEQRKTWVIAGPKKDAALRESGLLGPVVLTAEF